MDECVKKNIVELRTRKWGICSW